MNKTAAVLWLSFLCCSNGVLCAKDAPNEILARHTADLVVLKGDKLVPLNAAALLPATYTVVYFSAGWCPDCRRFSPNLVDAYNHQPPGGSRYEVLLVSRDKSAEGMVKYMKTERMPWPALAFEKISAAKDVAQFDTGHGIPCLTVIDSKGAVVVQSKNDQDANEVLKELLQLVSAGQRK